MEENEGVVARSEGRKDLEWQAVGHKKLVSLLCTACSILVKRDFSLS